NVADAPDLDMDSRHGETTWDALTKKIDMAYQVTRGAMFIGDPGTGKSYMIREIQKMFNYSDDEIFGPVTTGPDTAEGNLTGRRVDKGDVMVSFLGKVGEWATHKDGGLLWIDEANLTDPAFWNFLRGAFSKDPHVWINGVRYPLSPRHRIAFTGNFETLEG